VSKKSKARENVTVTCSYFVVLLCGLHLWLHHSDKDFSFVMTVAGMSQTLAFFLLMHKMRVQKSAEGVSSKMLQVYCLVFIFRLSSTMVKNGYLPMDATGDWAYQACDITSLFLVFQALFMVHKRFKTTYQEDLDTLPVGKMVLPAMVLAVFLHGDLNHSPLFDTVWTISMNLDTIAMLPQLWMFVKKGGSVDKMASHFVALVFFSRCLTWSFWYTGFPELAPTDGGFNKIGWLLMTMHTLQLLCSADFMMHYFIWQGSQCGSQCQNDCHGQMSSSNQGLMTSSGQGIVLPVLPVGAVHDV